MNHSHTEERTLEFVPENIVQLHQALCKLMAALMEYLGIGYQARGEENSKRWRHLNWEDFSQGIGTSPRQNLLNLTKHLWKYLLLDYSKRTRAFSSMYREGVWRQFAMRYGTTFEERVQYLLQFFNEFASMSEPQASQLTRSNDINLEEFGILNEYWDSL